MGRVYAVDADTSKGEILAFGGYRVFTANGVKIPYVSRVEFDDDADQGFATVTMAALDAKDGFLIDYQADAVCWVKVRTWVQVAKPGETDPSAIPSATLWKNADGSVTVGEDPIPEVPFQLVEAGA